MKFIALLLQMMIFKNGRMQYEQKCLDRCFMFHRLFSIYVAYSKLQERVKNSQRMNLMRFGCKGVLLCFLLFQQFTSRLISDKMEMNFETVKEIFVKNKINNKNLFHFLHRCHILEYSNESLQPIFQISLFLFLVIIFGRRF